MIYVANWKMNMHTTHALQFCTDHKSELINLSQQNNTTLILCPSFPPLFPITQVFEKTNVFIGAQNCSSYDEGAYTGDVSAQSLTEMGVTYCIVGHSERRIFFKETNESIAQKVEQLLENNITPILCIGETKKQFEAGETVHILKEQLKEPIQVCKNRDEKKEQKLIVAYEPVWSIGTGIIPKEDYINQTFIWLRRFFNKRLPRTHVSFLYGGSVKPYNIATLKKIESLNGFLIGGASTDFQTLKKIVS